MSFNRFPPNSLVEIDGAPYKPCGYLAGRLHLVHTTRGDTFKAPQPDGSLELITDEQFDQLLLEERAFVVHAYAEERGRRMASAARWTIDQAMKLDPKVEKKMVQMLMLDDAGIPNGDKAIERHFHNNWDAKLIEKYGPHDPVRTVRHWRATRGTPEQRHPRDLVNESGKVPRGPYAAEIPSEVLQKHALAFWTTKARIKDSYAEYAAEIKEINDGLHPTYPQPDEPYMPASEKTLRRRCERIEQSATDAAKNGSEKLEQDWLGGGRPLTAEFAMQRVIVDHTRLDVHAVDDEREMVLGRAWLTVAIDVRSRACVGHLISFIDPSTWTVGEILRRIALPKRPPAAMAARYPILAKLRGKPTELIMDNAVEFRSAMLEMAARCAGFHLRFCPFKRPRYRAIGERAIGTLTRMICSYLPGRTLPLAEAKRLDHNPEKEACVIMQELEAVANQAVAEYNTSPHDGLNGRQPALVFQRDLNRHGVNNIVDFEAFRRDTMAIQTGAQITPSGIRAFNGLRYHDVREVPALLDSLVPLECRRQRRDDATATVDFRYDPLDISRIEVWNRATKRHVTLRCADESYADGMPLAFHEQIRARAKAEGEAFNTKEERLLARARRIQAIRNIDPKEKARARKLVADLYEIPRIRQITGNIVDLHTEGRDVATTDEFISNDRAASTTLDREILAARRTTGRKGPEDAERDRRDAGKAETATPLKRPRRRPPGASAAGDYK